MLKRVRIFTILTLTALMAFFYQNCSSVHNEGSEVANKGALACGDLKGLFEQGYRPFLRTHCQRCHTLGGPGKGQFADSNLDTAWNSFQLAGFSRVSDFAVSASHNPPNSGPQHNEAITGLREQWLVALEDIQRCQTSDTDTPVLEESIGPRLVTTAKTLGLNSAGDKVTIEWDLATELLAEGERIAPSLSGTKLSVDVELQEVLGQITYLINNPRIYDSETDLHLYSLRTKINGSYIVGETTFTFVDRNIYADTDVLISAGTMVVLGLSNASDTIELSFDELDIVTLPPRDLGPEVTLTSTSSIYGESVGSIDIDVTLSKQPVTSTTVRIEATGESTGRLRRGPRTMDDPYDRFDWDFTFGTVEAPSNSVTLTFVNGAPLTQTATILISNDQRDEPEETLELIIASVENGVAVEASSGVTIRITDDDESPANPLIPTFTQLMTGNGVLKRRCLECHNTVDKEGGYDLTDYDTMVSAAKRILVPGDPLDSEMIKRIRLQGPGRMPLDQALDPSDQELIERWIEFGNAANN